MFDFSENPWVMEIISFDYSWSLKELNITGKEKNPVA
jgi:hypothetical protein